MGSLKKTLRTRLDLSWILKMGWIRNLLPGSLPALVWTCELRMVFKWWAKKKKEKNSIW